MSTLVCYKCVCVCVYRSPVRLLFDYRVSYVICPIIMFYELSVFVVSTLLLCKSLAV